MTGVAQGAMRTALALGGRKLIRLIGQTTRRISASADDAALGVTIGSETGAHAGGDAPRQARPRKDWAAEFKAAKEGLAGAGSRPHAQMFVRLSLAQRMCGDISGAAEAVSVGLAKCGETAGLVREAGEIAMLESRWDDAADAWARSVALSGEKPTPGAFARWAVALQKLNKHGEALAVLSRGLSYHPGDAKLVREHDDLVWLLKTEEIVRRAPPFTRRIRIEEVCEAIWSLEARLSLLSWRIGDVAPWPLLRMPLYYSVTQRLGLYDPPHPALKGQMELTKGWAPALEAEWAEREAALAGAMVGRARHRSAVLMATRKVGGSEPYTAALRAELGDEALLLDVAPKDHATPGALAFHSYKDLFRARYRRAEAANFTRESRELCEAVWRGMFEMLGTDVGNLARVCRNRVADFEAVSHGFQLLFASYDVGALYLTNAYGATQRAVVHAARQAGAHVTELQHGFISRYHLGYSWPGSPDVPYSPDELWFFGAFWPETTPLPKQMAHRVIGAPYLKSLADTARGQPRDERLVVFTSQGVIGRRLFDLALETARLRPDYRFIFRLHPNEELADYEALLTATPNVATNFSLSHGAPNIFALLAGAAIQVGVFSTTLFEGMVLGTRTIVVAMAGVEYMRPAVERGDVLMVSDVAELAAKLDAAPLCADPEYYYAEPPARLL